MCSAFQQALQTPRHVTDAAHFAHRVQIGVVRPLMGPAQALGDLGQCRDLGGVRPALEAMGEDAVTAAHAHAPQARTDNERECRFIAQC